MPADTGDIFHSPAERGPYEVGTFEAEMSGPGGLTLVVQAWYPTIQEGGDLHRYDDLLAFTALHQPPAHCSSPRPVVVFSHGNSGVRWQSAFLTEHLASHGFVVVAPDHKYNTLLDHEADRLTEVALRRPEDVSVAFDWATTAPGLEGCVEEEAGYAVAGHSFGGYTALAVSGAFVDLDASLALCDSPGDWLLCGILRDWSEDNPEDDVLDFADPRVWAGVPMCPAGYEAFVGGLQGISAPTMILGGSLDDITTMEGQVGPIFQGLTAVPRYLGELADAGHYSFSDVCSFYPYFEDCAEPFAAPEVVHGVVNTVVTALLHVETGWEEAAPWLHAEDHVTTLDLRWTAVEE